MDNILNAIKHALLNALFKIKMTLKGRDYLKYSLRALGKPSKIQQELLIELLKKNRSTTFGKQHGFATIGSLREYSRTVPLQDYESLRPYITTQREQKTSELTAEQPIMYAQTSGTMDEPKYIPVTPASLGFHKLNQGVFTWTQYRSNPRAFSGRLLGFAGAAEEGYFSDGAPYGSVSGVMYRSMPLLAQSKYIVPYPVFELEDYELKYLLIARLALAEKNITYVAAANPTTLLRLLTVIRANWKNLLDDIESGDFSGMDHLPESVKKAVMPRLKPDSLRAWELQSFPGEKSPRFADIWPDLQIVVTWTGGSCGIALDALKKDLATHTDIFDLGYVSSEFFGSITINSGYAQGLPTLYANIFEFVERDDWDDGVRDTIGLGQLEHGKEYQVIVTTTAGLHRYLMNDILKVTGFIGKTPLLAFLQKGKGVTSLCGEKLYESQVIQAVQEISRERFLRPHFYLMLADKNRNAYLLYCELHDPDGANVDNLSELLDQKLMAINIEYQAKRHSGRLGPLEFVLLRPGAGESCKQFYLAQGRREQQFKLITVQYREDLDFPIEEHRA
jgi:hypothetical protein